MIPSADEFDVPESVGEAVPPVEEKPKKKIKKEDKPRDDEEIPF